MPSVQAQAIRAARLAVGLTQEQLGHRIGVQAQSIYRWERDATAPKRRHRTALVTAISLINAEAGTRLKAAFDPKRPQVTEPALSPPPAHVPPDTTYDLVVLSMADHLDRSPRHVRVALLRMCDQLEHAGLTLDGLRASMQRALRESAAPALSITS